MAGAWGVRTAAATADPAERTPARPYALAPMCSAAARPLAHAFHASAAAEAKILASDPIETVCGDILKARGHDLTTVDKTPKPAELLQIIGDYEGLIVRR